MPQTSRTSITKRSRQSKDRQRGKAARALLDRIDGPAEAGFRRRAIEATATSLWHQIMVGEEDGLHYPREVRQLLDRLRKVAVEFSVVAGKDAERRSALVKRGVKRLGFPWAVDAVT